MVVTLALSAALLFAVSTTVKHASAAATPPLQTARPSGLAGFIRATVTHRLWLLGIACDAGALTLQILALHLGSLVVVQPLLIAGLIFALLLRRLSGRRHVSGRQLGWAALLAAGLAGFVTLASRGTSSTREIDHSPALYAGLIGAAALVGCVVLGRRIASRGTAATLLGAAVGLIYATTAALLKALSTIAVEDVARLPVSWQLYATVALGGLGLLLNQLAFQAGPLAASLPATATVDPLASIVIGVVVFDEQIRLVGTAGLVLALCLTLMAVSIVTLARSAPQLPTPAAETRAGGAAEGATAMRR